MSYEKITVDDFMKKYVKFKCPYCTDENPHDKAKCREELKSYLGICGRFCGFWVDDPNTYIE